jgi:transposase
MDYQKYLFVGVDTHKNQHTAVVINCFHQSLGHTKTVNDPDSFDEFIAKLNSLSHNNETLIFGLEDTQGLGHSLAQWLIEKGYTVKEVNPTFTKRERDHSTNPDKSDPVDAEAVANALYANLDKLPNIEEDAIYKAVRQLNNQRKSLVKRQTQLKNRLHNLIHQQYPHYEKFFSDTFGKTAMAFWETFPHPAELKHYAEKRLNKFLKNQTKNISNDKAKIILSLVNKDSKKDISTKTRNSLIPIVISQLRLTMDHIEQIDQELKKAVDKCNYQLTTMPGISYTLAAKFIANIRNINRFDSADKLARYAGLAPAEYSSGKSHKQNFKKYGNRDLNHAFYTLALQQIGSFRNGRIKNPVAYNYYQKKLAEGKARKVALTCLQRRLVDIIYAMMRDRSAYKLPEIQDYKVLNKAAS